MLGLHFLQMVFYYITTILTSWAVDLVRIDPLANWLGTMQGILHILVS